MTNRKIVIIGGGIGGLMAAIALNKKGIASTVYEKVKSLETVGAGLALWANATSIFDKFGLLNNLVAKGIVLDNISFSTSDGKPLSVFRVKDLEHKFKFPSIVLLRHDLQKELLNAIPSSQIKFDKQCVKVEKKSTKLNVHFTDGTIEIADIVIFGDGIHSLARKDIFGFPPLKYAGRTSWRGIAEFSKPVFSNNTSLEIFGKGKRIGIFPLPNNLAYWYAAVNMTEKDTYKQKRTIDCVRSHFENWSEPVNTLFNNTAENRLILTNIIYAARINKLVTENIALIGDAAHPMTPDLGQGACQAIEDAFYLVDELSQPKSISESLKCYEAKRLKRVQSISLNSFRIGRMRQMESPIGVMLRNNLFRILPNSFTLKMLERNIKIEI